MPFSSTLLSFKLANQFRVCPPRQWAVGSDAATGYTNVLYRFDTTLHTFSASLSLGVLTGEASAFGATWGTPNGYIYGEDNYSGRIYKFYLPALNGILPVTYSTYQSEGSIDNYSDGARCVNATA